MEKVLNCLACNSKNFNAFIKTTAMMHEQGTTKYNFDKCENCGLVFLNSRIPESELGPFYSENYLPYRVEEAWGKYANFVKRDQQNIDQARVKRVKDYNNLTRESRILDVGCGKPTFLAQFYKDTPAHLIGLDFSDEGWKNNPEIFRELDLRVGEVSDLKGESAVDVITMWHYLEHDYEPQKHLKNLLDIAHSETKLIIEVPNFDSYTRRKFGEHWAGYHSPRHTALYSANNIEMLLKNSGWQVEHILTFGTLNPFTIHWMSEMERKGIDWSGSMESRFIGFVAGMILYKPIYMFQKWFSMGFLTVIAKPA